MTFQSERLLHSSRDGSIQLPTTLDDSIDFVVSRILDALNIDNSLFPRWRESEEGVEGSRDRGAKG